MERTPGTDLVPFIDQKFLDTPFVSKARREYDTPHLTAEDAALIAKYVDVHFLFLPHDHAPERYLVLDEAMQGLSAEHGRLIIEQPNGPNMGEARVLSDPVRRREIGVRRDLYMGQVEAGQRPQADSFVFARVVARSKGVPVVFADFSGDDLRWWDQSQDVAGNEALPDYYAKRGELIQDAPNLPFAEAVAIYSILYQRVNEEHYGDNFINMPEMQRQRDRVAINILKYWALHDARQAEASGMAGKKRIVFVYGTEHAQAMRRRTRDYGIPYTSQTIPHELFCRHDPEGIDGITEQEFMLDLIMVVLAKDLPGITEEGLDTMSNPIRTAINALPSDNLRDIYELYRNGQLREAGETDGEHIMRLFTEFSDHIPAARNALNHALGGAGA